MNKNNYDSAIELLQTFFQRHVKEVHLSDDRAGSVGLALVDPIADQIVGSHYGLSHYCAGLIMLSRTRCCDVELLRSAERCLSYIESTQVTFSSKSDYHNDFNNFAWSLLLLIDRDKPGYLPENLKIRLHHLLMSTKDSKHDTVNWLPMRAINNFARFSLTGSGTYLSKARALLLQVARAQGADGMYDDLLPAGQSGNIQYHVYTTAVIQLIRHFNLDSGGGDLQAALAFTVQAIDPDGDFNYFGRGANQIFGWGPFFFNLEAQYLSPEVYCRSLAFFNNNLQHCLNNKGLYLKNSYVDQHILWWDYHHVTVYTAHLFFWINILQTIIPNKVQCGTVLVTKNITVYSKNNVFCTIFAGKKTYLSERGPELCNIWTKGFGSLYKGPFGPFFGQFGNNQICKSAVVCNHFGLLSEYPVRNLKDYVHPFILRILKKLKIFNKARSDYAMVLEPLFPKKLTAAVLDDFCVLEYIFAPIRKPVSINLPLFQEAFSSGCYNLITAEVNGIPVQLYHLGSACGVYGKFELLRSKPQVGVSKLVVRISLSEIK